MAKTKWIHLRVSDQEAQELQELASDYETVQAELLRRTIKFLYLNRPVLGGNTLVPKANARLSKRTYQTA